MKKSTLLLLFIITSLSAFAQSNQAKKCRCCEGAYQDFAFWVGEWEVYDSAGTKHLGDNSIQFVQDSCVMQENWSSGSSPYTGTSYNFYDAATSQWRQVWVDNQGGNLDIKGGLDDQGRMVLSSEEQTDKEGKKYQNRIIWTLLPDGRVQQLWQTTYDQGQTWTSVFNGYYKRKEE